MRVIEHFDRGAERFSGRACLVDAHGSRSYEDVRQASHVIANALTQARQAPGTKAAVYSANAARSFECVLGILRAGLVWVPVNVRNTVADSIFTLQACEVEVLFYQRAYRENARAMAAACVGVRVLVCIDGADAGAAAFEEFTAGCAAAAPEPPGSDDDVATLFSSGGTTGVPKAVMMSHRSWESMTLGCQLLMPASDPVHLVAAPMTHAAGGSALAYASMGMTNVMLPGFEPAAVMQAIEQHRVTHLFLPPTAIYRLLAHPAVRGHDYSSLRYFTYSSAPMSIEKLKEAVAVFGPVMTNSFGQSETGLLNTYLSPAEVAAAARAGDDRRLASVGRATPWFRIEIMSDDGTLLPRDTPGEIVLRSAQISPGYFKNPEETARARTFGWHHTGDIGTKDTDGYLYIVDRKKDMIITGGFNVYPAEVERILADHPDVQDCAVIGLPDPEWGERVTAVVELKAGVTATPGELIAFCRERLAGYRTPKEIRFTASLPRSPVGKVLRRLVREQAAKASADGPEKDRTP
jgi:acyl-CoA synthetase (AMP-forming)/AMP-acid ligase II